VNGEAAAKYDEAVATIQANAEARPEACARAQAMWDQYLFILRAEGNGANCPLSSEDALAMLDEALAACSPPVAAVDSDYVVYFGFDRTDLTSRAIATIGNAADSYAAMDASAVSVVGHTDRAGSVEYNQGLSERRARRVAAALQDRGVPRGAMTLAGRSELEPARVTEDGVREPLNRRVEITLSE
jgi:outer membrane protein OmpA-like peptidoglycan-associated protein